MIAEWFIVLATSAGKIKVFNNWEKENNSDLYFMQNWNWPEIFAAYW